jgi:hypothetical protein
MAAAAPGQVEVGVAPACGQHHARLLIARPWGKLIVDGVRVVPAGRLPSMLRHLPAVLGPGRTAELAERARTRFHPAA